MPSASLRLRFAFARSRPRRKLTLCHKTNVLTYAGDLWQRTFDAVAAEHPDVTTEYANVDAAGRVEDAVAALNESSERRGSPRFGLHGIRVTR